MSSKHKLSRPGVVNKRKPRKPRVTWAIKPIQKPHSKKGYNRNDEKVKNRGGETE